MTLKTPGPAIAVVALLALAGCNQIGNPVNALTGGRPAPDEFMVVEHAPLRMPAGLDLPAPQPGAPSSLAPQPRRAAETALFGAPVRMAAHRLGAGERALLQAADTAAANPKIRQVLKADRESADQGPYKAPLLWEILGTTDDLDVDPEAVLDPDAEAHRLHAEGVAPTPVDPDARRADKAEVDVTSPGPNIPDGPRNTLP